MRGRAGARARRAPKRAGGRGAGEADSLRAIHHARLADMFTWERQVLVEKAIRIENKYGLHARPAMQFVELAGKFSSQISLTRGEKAADAKSIMEVLMLAAEKGSELVIRADGNDAESAVEALEKLVASKFDEE